MPATESTPCPKCGADMDSPVAECNQCLLELGFGATTIESTEVTASETRTPAALPVFADYELLEEIARGGMGIVYRARQRSLDRTVALKLILGGQLVTRELVHRFRVEASAAAALQHPNIVSIHDVGVHDGNHFFSMEYVEGQNLGQLVRTQPLPAIKAARYLKIIAEAIHYAHEQGILHRDLKPSNVLVDAATDQPRVTDFGLAKRMNGDSSLTLSGQVLGSPPFMPPEQASSQRGKVGRKSDVYGLGAILYFLLTARPPFQGDSLEATITQVLHEEPVSPRLLNPTVPKDLETICLKCLTKEPSRRYPSAQAMGEDVSRFIKGEHILARPTTRLERTWRWCRRKPAFASVLALASVLILTLAIGGPIVALQIQRARHIAETHLYSADINMAQTALSNAQLILAREKLDRHRPEDGHRDQRGFEWRYLWELCQSDERHALEPEIKWPSRVAFSPDGRLVAGHNKEKETLVWDVATKEVVKRLTGNRLVTFDPKRPFLITAGETGLNRWHTETWKKEYLGPAPKNAAAMFSPDNRWLVVSGIQVWDTETWELKQSNDTFGNLNFFTSNSLSVSHDSTMISCATGQVYASTSKVGLFRLPSLEPVTWSHRLPKGVGALAFHPKRNLLVTGDWSGNVRLWDTTSGEEVPSHMRSISRIMAMAFSPADPDLLAVGGGDRSIHLWDVVSQRERNRLDGASTQIVKLAFSPDGQTIASGSNEDPITLWNVGQTKADTFTVPTKHRNYVLGHTEDGKRLVTMDATGQVMHRDATSFDVLETLFRADLESASVGDATFLSAAITMSRDGKQLALGMKNGSVEVWDLETQSNLSWKAHENDVCGVAFSPNSRELITVARTKSDSEHGDVHLWDLATQSQLESAELEQVNSFWSTCPRFSPDGKIIAVGSGNQLSIFHRKNLQPIRKPFEGLAGFIPLHFSPDGRYLASGHGPGGPEHLIVWDTHDWSRRLLPGLDLVPSDIAFSPEGDRMVSVGEQLIFWDTDTWQELARYRLPIHDTSFTLFSPDGTDLVTSDPEGLRIWRAPSFKEITEREVRDGRWP